MGSHTFIWPYHAGEVYVTGTFDNWAKSVKLDKHGDVFQKTVDLPAEKVLYKYVVDGNWTTDENAPLEHDHQGIANNVLSAHQIQSESTSSSSNAFISSVAPAATTTAMAGAVPLEQSTPEIKDEVPGAFPETPGNELDQFSVNPLPATSTAPVPGGEGASNPVKLAPGDEVPDPSSLTSNTVSSTVKHDDSEPKSSDRKVPDGVEEVYPAQEAAKAFSGKHDDSEPKSSDGKVPDGVEEVYPAQEAAKAFSVNPLPATSGIGNPIKLAAGEPVPDPSTFTTNTIHSTVGDMETDTGAPQIPPILSPGSQAEANGSKSVFEIPPIGSGSGPLIPESSLFMGAGTASTLDAGPTISSVSPQSTTAALAGQVPIRERGVPTVVSDNEGAEDMNTLDKKQAVEEELTSKVPEAPGSTALGHGNAEEVPATVTESQYRAHADPEAASSPTAVHDKSTVEDELKHKVPEAPSTSESGILGKSERGITGAIAGGAVAAAAAATAGAYALKDKAQPVLDKAQPALDKAAEYTGTTLGTESTTHKPSTVPLVVKESQHDAHVDPEAASNPVAVAEKADMESELKAAVPAAPSTSESGLLGKSEGGVAGTVAAGTAAAGTAVAGAAYAARDKAAELTNTTPTTFSPRSANVPPVVKDSQEAAHVSPEAAANPEALSEKADMETQLKAAVPEAPSTSESGLLGKSEGGISAKVGPSVAAGTAAAGAAVAGAVYAGRDKAAELTGQDKDTILPPSVQSAIDSMNNKGTTAPTTVTGSSTNGFNDEVPDAVKDSQKAAHVSPEASAVPAAVAEKSQMEKELLKEIKPAFEAGEPAPTASAALSSVAPVKPTTGSSTLESSKSTTLPEPTMGAPPEGLNAGANSQAQSLATKTGALAALPDPEEKPSSASGLTKTADSRPTTAKEIADRATAPSATTVPSSPAAAADPSTDSSKPTFSDHLAAPESKNAPDSRDVSPMSKIPTTDEPVVTTGAEDTKPGSTTTPSQTPQATPSKDKSKRSSAFFKNTPDSSRTSMTQESSSTKDAEAKPKKKGFLSKLKEKLKG